MAGLTVILAEKPRQARAYAEALTGKLASGRGPFVTPLGIVVTAQGHLRRYQEPRDRGLTNWSDPSWPDLTIDPPMCPRDREAAAQLKQITAELGRAERIIVATDPDREGDAIAWNILAMLRRLPARIDRMTCSEVNLEPIRAAFAALEPAQRTRARAAAASARARIDQLAGTNLTVAVATSLRPAELRGVVWPVGRVKTPTLWLAVERERAIQAFRAVDHYVLAARFEASLSTGGQGEVVLVHRPDPYLTDAPFATRLAEAANGASATLSVQRGTKRVPPQPPFDKPSLLQAAAKRLGWRLDVTTGILQELYDAGHLTYPRSGCRKLSSADLASLGEVCAAIATRPDFANAALRTSAAPVVRRGLVVDDAAVARASHTAIIPTKVPLPKGSGPAWQLLYDLVARQYIAAFAPDGTDETVKVSAVLVLLGTPREFVATTRRPLTAGWRDIFGAGRSLRSGDGREADGSGEVSEAVSDAAERIPTGLASGPARCIGAAPLARTTEAPERYTLGSLMADMRRAHCWVQDPVLAEALRTKDHPGIGTPATIETIPLELIAKGLLEEMPGRSKVAALRAPDHAVALVSALERAIPDFVRPDLTAKLEIALLEISDQSDHRAADVLADRLVVEYAGLVERWFQAIKSLKALPLANAAPVRPAAGQSAGSPAGKPARPRVRRASRRRRPPGRAAS